MPFVQTQPNVPGIDTGPNSPTMIVRPVVLVDCYNNPISSINPLTVSASFSAASLALNDPTVTTQKMGVDSTGNAHVGVWNAGNQLAIDGSGVASVKFGGSLPAGSNVIGHVIVDSAGSVSVTSLPSLPAGSNVIGHVVIDSASNVSVSSLPALPTGSNVIGHVVVDSAGSVSVTSLPSLPAGTNVIGSTLLQSVSGTPLAADQSNTELRVSTYVKTTTAGDTPLTTGQKTMANSLPTTIASDQSTIPATISGPAGDTFTVQVTPQQELKVSEQPTSLFFDSFGTGTLDTTNNWKSPTASGGGVAASNANQMTVLGSGTTGNGYSYLESVPSFTQGSSGTPYQLMVINVEYPVLTNACRFWGAGTSPGSPTTSAPLTNAVGFELYTDGKLYAVIYTNGTRTVVQDLSSTGNNKQPQDAYPHLYTIWLRGDHYLFFIDNEYSVVAQTQYSQPAAPVTDLLPIKIQTVAGPTPPTSNAQVTLGFVTVQDTGRQAFQLSDGTYPWKKAVIDSIGSLAVKGNYLEKASLSAGSLNADLVASFDVSSYKWWSLQVLTVATGGVLTFQGSNDNTNFVSVEASNISSVAAPGLTTNATGIYYGICSFRYLRIRQTSYTSGSSTGVLELYTSATDFVPTTLSSVQSGTWTVQPGNTANTTAWFANSVGTTGGTTSFHLISAATTNATSVKASAGQVYGYDIYNANAAARFVKLYNKASAPTVGTDTPIRTIGIPPATRVVGEFSNGINCATGIALATTTGITDADTNAVTLSDLAINLDYK